jgi:hypothetical protein
MAQGVLVRAAETMASRLIGGRSVSFFIFGVVGVSTRRSTPQLARRAHDTYLGRAWNRFQIVGSGATGGGAKPPAQYAKKYAAFP